MKPVFAKILDGSGHEVFATRRIERPYFTTEFHFHKEAQLTYVVESEGRRMIGDSVENFFSGELTLLGANLPHVWHNDPQDLPGNKKDIHARSVALFFDPEKTTELLSHFTDINRLEQLFHLAQRGMLFYGGTKEQLKDLLFEVCNQEGLNKLIGLLKIFEFLCSASEYQLLASQGYTNTYQAKDNERIDRVLKFVFDHYAKEIVLDEVAALANMSKQAFCRYFKSRTQKTFITFVNEVRIAQACKLMAHSNQAISTIAYQCGFNSLSNFNRFFKELRGMTPRAYLEKLGS
ncbi:AraC family transcriptional regulator [Niabella beijingensis]|uniref:AraC family transcriptional regulator n=1 Tax=Niabella beijingensis TaxID=2872700 RepID=UPI001CBD1E64|nr:AraC family transcriptional regulator [Niabella beijingensis]MBZ4191437.1 AraC family transcriptional regulator [Niabella beijingensis]